MTDEKAKKIPPQKKGGARYPRYDLKDAEFWGRKLVSKAHLAPQPQDIVFASVVESKGSTAEVKVSTLKQYGLMDGPSTAYVASDLAKKIASSPVEELASLRAQAALSPTIFQGLFNTFHGDEVSIARLRQRAAELKVHPDATENCVEIYVKTLIHADLASMSGEKVKHNSNSKNIEATALENEDNDIEAVDNNENKNEDINSKNIDKNENKGMVTPKAVFNVNVNLDSSLDFEKLEKQLQLLKKYGAI